MSINEHVMVSSDQHSSLFHPTCLLIYEQQTRGLPYVQCTKNRLTCKHYIANCKTFNFLGLSVASTKFQISRRCRHWLNKTKSSSSSSWLMATHSWKTCLCLSASCNCAASASRRRSMSSRALCSSSSHSFLHSSIIHVLYWAKKLADQLKLYI